MLDELATFLSDYLVSTYDQLTILALWIVHTWCFEAFSTTTYLTFGRPNHNAERLAASSCSLCFPLIPGWPPAPTPRL
jgi:hypothetical protein